MNQPSYDKYRARLKRGGLLVLNTSMAGPSDALERAAPAEILPIPATEAANDLGNVRVANVIILGAYLARKAIVSEPSVIACLQAEFAGREHLAEVNRKALQKGIELAGQGKGS
jgi:2-oxoglutarate ferredoxin oxidoreductase subunit gamma